MDGRIKTLINSGRIPQALVIEGGTREQREAEALNIAEAKLCTGDGAFACGECSSCKKVESNTHPDVIFIEPENGKKSISVDAIRRMREDAFILPNESDCKVYIIKQAETLQEYAQNALLKILEEPPKSVTFILTAQSKASLLATVLSRVAVISIGEQQEADIPDEQKQLADVCAKQIAEALVSKSEIKLLAATAVLEKNYDILPLALESLSLIFRDAMVNQTGLNNCMSGQTDDVLRLAETYDAETLINMLSAIADIQAAVNMHANKNLTLTRICSALADAAGGKR